MDNLRFLVCKADVCKVDAEQNLILQYYSRTCPQPFLTERPSFKGSHKAIVNPILPHEREVNPSQCGAFFPKYLWTVEYTLIDIMCFCYGNSNALSSKSSCCIISEAWCQQDKPHQHGGVKLMSVPLFCFNVLLKYL